MKWRDEMYREVNSFMNMVCKRITEIVELNDSLDWSVESIEQDIQRIEGMVESAVIALIVMTPKYKSVLAGLKDHQEKSIRKMRSFILQKHLIDTNR